ncbi:MAG: GMC oxidoreductase, partial [Bacteroidia bacterium]
VGEKDMLNAAGVSVKHDLPGVGKNLQDHIIFPMVFHNRDKNTLEHAESLGNLVNYLIWGEGALSSNIAEGGGFVHTQPGLRGPDIQYHFAPGFFMNHGFDNPKHGHGFSIGPTLLQPMSVGEVRIESNSAHASPIIDHQYLSHSDDMKALVAGYKIAMNIIKTEAFKPYFDGYFLPGKELLTDEEIADHIIHHFQTLYHPTGTCKMGSDNMAVVDDQLRVHGVQNLRVVDASIMPQIVRGNTHAPVMMIAEKAVDLILGVRKEAIREEVLEATA